MGKLLQNKETDQAGELLVAITRYSQAAYRELMARLFVLPRELRDMIYDELWNLDSCKTNLMIKFLHRGHEIGKHQGSFMTKPCSGTPDHAHLTCCCSYHLPDFSKQGLVGREVAKEVLEAFRKRDGPHGTRGSYSERYVSWNRLHELTTVEVFHSGFTLCELLENLPLVIVFDCLDEINGNEGLERVGIPGSFNAQLRRCIDALSSLRHHKPRIITFEFDDDTTDILSNMAYLFRSLSTPFHVLRHLGFDMRVSYHSYGTSEWDMSGKYNHHGPHMHDIYKWTLRDWSLNFTRVNERFQSFCIMGEAFVFNPNGPLHGRYRVKKPVWEAMSKELYRAYPEVDSLVKWTKDSKGEIWMDCGCVDGVHTCCSYYLCAKHGGWDFRYGNSDTESNTFCYICKGLVAPVL